MKQVNTLFRSSAPYLLSGAIFEFIASKLWFGNWFLTVVADLILMVIAYGIMEVVHRNYFVRRRKRR